MEKRRMGINCEGDQSPPWAVVLRKKEEADATWSSTLLVQSYTVRLVSHVWQPPLWVDSSLTPDVWVLASDNLLKCSLWGVI
jgi:hypothetical protein